MGWLFEHPTLSGGERSALAVIERLDADVVAFAPPEGALADALESRGIEHESTIVDRRHYGVPFLIDGLTAMLMGGLDLVHCNSSAIADLTGPAAARAGIPSIGHVREIMRHSKARLARIGECTRLLAVSEAAAGTLRAQGLTVEVAYNGIDADLWQVPPAPREDVAGPLLLTVGQLVRRKGIDVLLDALPDGATLWVAGARWSDKDEAREYEQAMREHAGDIRWLGWRDDVPALMAAADLLVHPARQEPLGRVILEAMASGTPVVATDVGGARELLGDDYPLVPPDDPVALRAAIAAALRDGLPDRQQRCREQFSVESAVKRIHQVHQELLA